MGALQTYFIDVLKSKYCQFSGRARRKEFWMFHLFLFLLYVVLFMITAVLTILWVPIGDASFMFMIFSSLAFIAPLLALFCRRLHDIGKSGTWLLCGLIPGVGYLILAGFAAEDSKPGPNQYGPNPKGIEI